MKKRQKGYLLYEVLISMLIASLGVLGAIGVLLMGSKSGTSGYLQQTSGRLALEIVDRMRNNPDEVKQGKYDLALGGARSSAANCVSLVCQPEQMADYDVAQWVGSLSKQLPEGKGQVTTSSSGNNTIVTIVVQWSDASAKKFFKDSDATAPARYTLQTVL